MKSTTRTGVITAIVVAIAVPLLVVDRSDDSAAAGDTSPTSARPSDSSTAGVTASGPDRELVDAVTDGIMTLPDGSYEMVGYGTVFVADGSEVTPLYVTTSTCTEGEPFDNALDVDHATDDGGQIVLDLVGSTTDFRLRPLVDAPACVSDPSESLTALEEVFATHYPFFTERDIDGNAAMTDIRRAVDDGATALPAALAAFMLELGDGHTTLDGLDIEVDPTDFGVADVITVDALAGLVDGELDRTLARLATVHVDDVGIVAWGTFDDRPDVGYLLIRGFLDDGDPLIDRDALVSAMDEAVASLETVDRLVVDMRFNQGGHEDLAVVAAGYFTEEPVDGYRKWAYAEPDPLAQTVIVDPAARRFDGDVAILTSPLTASAAEAFVLAMGPVAGATVVGTPTFGEFSDAIGRTLPDGTEFTMSMEVYTDLDGTDFEAVGLPVDIAAPFDASVDAALTLWPGDADGTP